MTLVTQAEYAKLHGVSRKTVTKWKDADYLVISEGKVDAEATDAVLKDRGLGRFGKGTGTVTSGGKGNSEKNARAPRNGSPKGGQAPVTAVDPDGKEKPLDVLVQDTDQLIDDILSGRHLPYAHAERIKENQLALKHVLDMRERAGSLVELEASEKLFFEVSRAARDALMDWPTRVGPIIAAELDVEADKVVELLTKYVQSILEKLGGQNTDAAGEAG